LLYWRIGAKNDTSTSLPAKVIECSAVNVASSIFLILKKNITKKLVSKKDTLNVALLDKVKVYEYCV
jgi:hypothetical protein